MKKFIQSLLCLCLFGVAEAENLSEVYQKALQFNPTYLGAAANTKVAQDQIAIARSALLPQLSASGNYQYTNNNTNGNGETQVKSQGVGYGLLLNQTLVDFSKIKNLDSTKASAIAAKLKGMAAKQDLMVQVATGYFAVALAQTELALDNKKLNDQTKIYHEAEQQFKAGQTTRTSATDAKAALTATEALVLQDKIDLSKKYSSLEAMTGTTIKPVAVLKKTLLIKSLKLNKPNAWMQKARLNNLSIQSQRYALQAAQENIAAANSGHLPTLNASLGYNSQNQITQNTTDPNILNKDFSAGVNLSFPIFSGGAILANTKQSRDRYLVTYQSFRGTSEQAFDQLRASFATLKNSGSLIKTLKKSVELQKQALHDTMISYNAGLQSMSDVLAAQDRLYSQQQQYFQQQYSYAIAYLQLLQSAGILNQQQLNYLNSFLG